MEAWLAQQVPSGDLRENGLLQRGKGNRNVCGRISQGAMKVMFWAPPYMPLQGPRRGLSYFAFVISLKDTPPPTYPHLVIEALGPIKPGSAPENQKYKDVEAGDKLGVV